MIFVDFSPCIRVQVRDVNDALRSLKEVMGE